MAEVGYPIYKEEETPPVWESWLQFVHPGAHGAEIPVQLSVIERTQLHLYHLWVLCHPSGQSKEREQPLPRRMSIRSGEVVVTAPHHQIGQRDAGTPS